MRHKLSVTLDQDIILKMNDKLRDGIFRNKSHMMEYAIRKLLQKDVPK